MSGLFGIILHWTAGGGKASDNDRRHYHYLVEQSGAVVSGAFPPEANAAPVPGRYAAHTLRANTGRIGIALCGMVGANERPFLPGSAPIKANQVTAFCGLAAALCRRYDIPVSRTTVLTHAEVQPTLHIRQRGKWDITWLPELLAPIDPIAAGDRLRAMILQQMKG